MDDGRTSSVTLECVDGSGLAAGRSPGRSQSGRERLRDVLLNERQRLVINRLLEGVEGKLTTSKWAALTKSSNDTALRDIQQLVERGVLIRNQAGGPERQRLARRLVIGSTYLDTVGEVAPGARTTSIPAPTRGTTEVYGLWTTAWMVAQVFGPRRPNGCSFHGDMTPAAGTPASLHPPSIVMIISGMNSGSFAPWW